MKRKLFLLLGSFIILLLAFGTYQLFVPGIAFFDPLASGRRRPPSLDFSPGHGPRMGVNRGVSFYYRTATGQLRGVYKVVSWTKEDDGSFVLEQPDAVIYQKDGTRVYMTADSGRIWAEEVSGGSNFNVRNGQLDGNVEIFFDQSTDDQYAGKEREHPRDRPQERITRETIRIRTSDVKFSRDMLEISTDSQVTLWSKRLDLVGRGLRLRWNESPRELRLLRIVSGKVMVVKELPEQIDMVQIPGTGDEPTTQPTTAATAKTKAKKPKTPAPSTAPKNLEDRWALETPQPVTPGEQEDIGVKISTAPTAATTAGAYIPPGMPEVRNIYKATFNKNVRIHSDERKLLGAKELSLVFEWDSRTWQREDEEKKPPASAASKPAGATQSATQPTTAVAAKDADKEPSDQRMEIYWDGPLEIVPSGVTPEPSRKRYKITGRGERVILSDPEARIVCREFKFINPQQEAIFTGDRQNPARLVLARGDEILCYGRIRFNRSKGKAYLDGPGRMSRYDSPAGAIPWDIADDTEDETRAVLGRVIWAGRVEAAFDERQITTSDGKSQTRPFIKDATFHKAVEMVQFQGPGEGASAGKVSSYVKCDKVLQLWMKTSPAGKAYPSRAHAKGNVSALQEGSIIAANEVDVTFRRKVRSAGKADKPEPKKSGGAISSSLGGDVEPVTLIAEGKVDITYKAPDKPNDPPMRVQADKVDADMTRKLAVLTGKPARIWQGPNRIEGRIINFDETAEAAKVTGAGRLEYLSDTDLISGKEVPAGQMVRVSWSKWMLYHGQSGQGICDGDVDFKSGGNMMQCRQIRLFFDKSQAAGTGAEKPAKELAKKSSRRSLGLEIDRFGSMNLTRIEAEGGKGSERLVLMRSQSPHPKNPLWVQRRMELRGKMVLYDARNRETYVNGEGTFLAEDYRPPSTRSRKPRRQGEDVALIGDGIERPSQTLFNWKESMYLNMQDRHVNLQKGVVMIHRSGNQLLKIKNLKTAPAGRLDKGRISNLRCEELDAWFDEPNDPAAPAGTRGVFDAGTQLGAMKAFSALRDVTFQDGPRRIDAQRVIYDGHRERINVWGYLEGDKDEQKTSAQITVQDPQTGMPPRTVRSPMLIYDMKNEKIIVEKIRGGGGL